MAKPATVTASRAANNAFKRPAWISVSIGGSVYVTNRRLARRASKGCPFWRVGLAALPLSSATFAFALSPTPQVFDERAQFVELVIRQGLSANQVHQQRSHRPAAELRGHFLELAANQFVSIHGHGKGQHPLATVLGGDKSFGFQAFQELLNGGVLSGTAAGIEHVGDLPAGARALVPQDLQNRQLGVSHILS